MAPHGTKMGLYSKKGTAAYWRQYSVVSRCDAVLAQNGPQPFQLSLHPAQFLSQRHATSSGRGPLLVPNTT